MVDFTNIELPDAQNPNASTSPATAPPTDFTNIDIPSAQPQKQGSTLGAAGAGFAQGMTNVGRGVAQLGTQAGEAVGLLPKGATIAFTKNMDAQMAAEQKQLQEDYPTNSIALAVGKFVGSVAPYLAIGPEGLLANAATWGAVGASQYVPKGGSRMENTLIGAGLGAAGSVVEKALGLSAGLANKIIPSSPNAARDVLAATTGAAGDAKQAAANKVGTFLTPGEASGSIPMQAAEGRIPTNQSSLKTIEDALGNRSNIVRDQVQSLVDKILPEGRDKANAAVKAMYESSKNVPIDAAEYKGLMANPIIKDALEKATNNPMFRMDQATPGTVGELDTVKKAIQSKIAENVTSGIKAEANVNLIDATHAITKAADNASPEYQAGRALSQKVQIQDNFQQKLDSLPLNGQQDAPSLGTISKNMFGTQAKIDDFMSELKAAGGDTQQAQNIISTLRAVSGSKIEKLLSKDPDVSDIGKVGSSLSGWLLDKTKSTLNAKYNQTLLELITNPQWKQAAADMAKQKTVPEKLAKLASALTPNQAAAVVPATSP